MVSFIATEVNINVLFVQGNGYLFLTFSLTVGPLLPWDLKHQHVASGPSTQNNYPGRVENPGEFGI